MLPLAPLQASRWFEIRNCIANEDSGTDKHDDDDDVDDDDDDDYDDDNYDDYDDFSYFIPFVPFKILILGFPEFQEIPLLGPTCQVHLV